MSDSTAKPVIVSEHFFTAYGGAKYGRFTRDEPQNSERLKRFVFCVLVLSDGKVVSGEYDGTKQDLFELKEGQKKAKINAMAKI